jgi:hypothetical protein
MRSLRLLLVISTFALAAAAPLASADGGRVVASANGGSVLTLHDVFGLALVELQPFTFTVQIHEDGSVHGHYNYRSSEDGTPFNASGPITCAVIVGNRAILGGLIESSSEPSLVGLDMWFQVADNGEPGVDATPDMSTLIGAGGAGSAQDYCDRAPQPRFPFPIEHGNIHVRPSTG